MNKFLNIVLQFIAFSLCLLFIRYLIEEFVGPKKSHQLPRFKVLNTDSIFEEHKKRSLQNIKFTMPEYKPIKFTLPDSLINEWVKEKSTNQNNKLPLGKENAYPSYDINKNKGQEYDWSENDRLEEDIKVLEQRLEEKKKLAKKRAKRKNEGKSTMQNNKVSSGKETISPSFDKYNIELEWDEWEWDENGLLEKEIMKLIDRDRYLGKLDGYTKREIRQKAFKMFNAAEEEAKEEAKKRFKKNKIINYKSDRLTFSYPDKYSEKKSMNYNHSKNPIKLVANTKSEDGSYDNIGIKIINEELPFYEKNDKFLDFFKKVLDDNIRYSNENQGLKESDSFGEIYSIERNKIHKKDIIIVKGFHKIKSLNYISNFIWYTFNINKSNCLIMLTGGTKKEISVREEDINYIIKTIDL